MAKQGGSTVENVWRIAEPIVESFGLTLWDVRYLKEGANWYLRIFIDKDEGVNINDCEKVSRALDEPLDALNLIDQSYCLEVSSPGIERELIRPEHFDKFIGSDIFVKTIRPIPNIGREFDGKLVSSDKTSFVISDLDGNELTIEKKDTAWVKLDDFDI